MVFRMPRWPAGVLQCIFFQEQLLEAMVGQDDELENHSIWESNTEGTSHAL